MSRRSRPTLRVLREDLDEGWKNPSILRTLGSGDVPAGLAEGGHRDRDD